MTPKKVLYISQEIYPYLPSSTLADLSRYLPEKILSLGDDVRIFMPKFGTVNERRNQLHEVIRLSGINVNVGDNDHLLIIKVASIPSAHLQIYFIDNDEYFKRKSMFDPAKGKENDNAERAIFFVRGVFEAIKKLRWIPDYVHCVGWFSGLAPAYVKGILKNDPALCRAKVITSFHGEEQEGELGAELLDRLIYDGFTPEMLEPLQGETTPDALRRMAVHYSDGLIVADPDLSPGMKEFIGKYPDKAYLECFGKAEENAEAYRDFYHSL